MNKRIYTNRYTREQFLKIANYVLEQASDNVSGTLGAYGGTSIIQEPSLGHIISKDGLASAKHLHFNDPVAATLYAILLEISEELVMKVGDGSSSCLVAARHFYEELQTTLDKVFSNKAELNLDGEGKLVVSTKNILRPQAVIDILNKCVNLIIDELNVYRRPVSEDQHEIEDIARISLNGSACEAKLIADIYKKIGLDGFINVKLGQKAETVWEMVKGFELSTGYLDSSLINNSTEESALENTAILVFAGSANDKKSYEIIKRALAYVNECYSKKQSVFMLGEERELKSLLILAPGYGDEHKQFFKDYVSQCKNLKFTVNLNVLEMQRNRDINIDAIEDLCYLTNARKIFTDTSTDVEDLLNKGNFEDFFGFAKNVVSSHKSTSFLETSANEDEVKKRILNVKHAYEQAAIDGNLTIKSSYEFQKRLAVLGQNLVTILVGGNNEQQRKTNKELLDDAVAACKSAIKHGYVIGGNLSIPICIDRIINKQIITDDKEMQFMTLLRNSMLKVYSTVLSNASFNDKEIDIIINESIKREKIFDLVNNEFTDTKVINSVETEIEILKNAITIVTLILTSNQFIQINPDMTNGIDIEL